MKEQMTRTEGSGSGRPLAVIGGSRREFWEGFNNDDFSFSLLDTLKLNVQVVNILLSRVGAGALSDFPFGGPLIISGLWGTPPPPDPLVGSVSIECYQGQVCRSFVSADITFSACVREADN